MPIALSTARSYDWIHDALTQEEREKVVAMIRADGRLRNLIVADNILNARQGDRDRGRRTGHHDT